MHPQRKTVRKRELDPIPAVFNQLHVGGRTELSDESDVLRGQLLLLGHPLRRSLYEHQHRPIQLWSLQPGLYDHGRTNVHERQVLYAAVKQESDRRRGIRFHLHPGQLEHRLWRDELEQQ